MELFGGMGACGWRGGKAERPSPISSCSNAAAARSSSPRGSATEAHGGALGEPAQAQKIFAASSAMMSASDTAAPRPASSGSTSNWASTDRPNVASTQQVDGWLAGVLANARNRDSLARLEAGLVSFMANPSATSLPFPPCSHFRRRVCIEVAQRFGLECRLDRPLVDDGNPDTVLLVLVKGPASAVPDILLSQLSAQHSLDSSTKPAFLKRPASGPRSELGSGPTGAGSALGRAAKCVSAEEYEIARARIFKDGRAAPVSTYAAGVDCVAPSISKSRSRSNSDSAIAIDGDGSNKGSAEESSVGMLLPSAGRVGRGMSARAVDEGKPLARRRGSNFAAPGNPKSGPSAATSTEPPSEVVKNGNGADEDDPDFDRCYDKWAVRGAPQPPPTQLGLHSGFPSMLYGQHPPGHTYAMHAMAHVHAQAHAHAAAQAQCGVYAAPLPTPPSLFSVPLPAAHPSEQNRFFSPPPFQAGANAVPHLQGVDRRSMTAMHEPHSAPPAQPGRSTPYGLDSASDFPPLSAALTESAPQKSRQ